MQVHDPCGISPSVRYISEITECLRYNLDSYRWNWHTLRKHGGNEQKQTRLDYKFKVKGSSFQEKLRATEKHFQNSVIFPWPIFEFPWPLIFKGQLINLTLMCVTGYPGILCVFKLKLFHVGHMVTSFRPINILRIVGEVEICLQPSSVWLGTHHTKMQLWVVFGGW